MTWFRKRSSSLASERSDTGATNPGKASRLLAQGRAWEACVAFDAMGAAESRDPDVLSDFGRACLASGSFERALVLFDRSLEVEPNGYAAMRGRAELRLRTGNPAVAAADVDRALEVHPGDPALLRIRAASLLRLGNPEAAEALLAGLVESDPADAAAWDLLGMARLAKDGPAASLSAFAEAFRRATCKGSDAARFNYPITLAQLGRTEEALSTFELELRRRPEPFGMFVYAMALLQIGACREGWKYYEFRWMTADFLPARLDMRIPPWTGQDVAGRNVILVAEQGYGDTIQFVRYAKLVNDLGAVVTVIAKPEIAPLLGSAPGVHESAHEWKHSGDPDFYAYLMSLPRLFDASLENIPAEVPYLHASEDLTTRWRQRLGDGPLKVGLAWAGDPKHGKDRFRSLPIEALAPIAKVEGARLYCLHKAPPTGAVASKMDEMGIADLSSLLVDFSETAAAIAALDLVISVDTSIAHLAGALGKPVWLLNSHQSDFRWMENVESSPWYPTMRIFRQTMSQSWLDVTAFVASELARGVSPPAPFGSVGVPGRDFAAGLAQVVVCRHGTLSHLPDGTKEAVALETYGEWQPRALDATLGLLRAGAVVLDVLPGIGFHSVAIGKALGESGHLIAIEGRTPQCHMLEQNLVTNGVRSFSILAEANASLDALDFERIDLLRVGASADALGIIRGLQDTIWKLRPIIVVESDPEGAEFHALLRDMGYRTSVLRAGLFEPSNFARRGHDVFAGERYAVLFALPEERDEEDFVQVDLPSTAR